MINKSIGSFKEIVEISRNSNCTDDTEINVINTLKSTRNILEYMNSKKPCSLGIHPFIYFYSIIGKHKIGSYYGFLLFKKDFIERKKLDDFISVRAQFEDFIYHYSFLVQQIVRKYRQSKMAYSMISKYYETIMNLYIESLHYLKQEVANKLRQTEGFKYLQVEIIDNDVAQVKGNFSRGKKRQVKLKTFVASLPKCPICGGYMDNYSISVDHIVQEDDGGDNTLENAQVTHIYCNTSYKN